MSKNLITGGLGHLGCFLARRLLEMGEEVVLFDLVTDSRLISDIKGKLKIVRGDLTNWVDVIEAVKGNSIDCVYHAGALLPPGSEQRPAAAYMVNVNGTFNVLEAARLLGVGSVLFISTMRTYGPEAPPVVSEDVPQMPNNMYGVTKVCGERLGEYYHRRFGVNFRGVRLPLALGPGRSDPIYYTAWAWQAIQEPALGRPFTIAAEETACMPLVYIKDVVEALIGLKRAGEKGLKRRMYNLHGFSPTAREIANTVRKHLPQANIGFRPDPAVMEVVRSFPRQLDATRALEEWSWRPRYDLEGMVRDFIADVQSNPAKYG